MRERSIANVKESASKGAREGDSTIHQRIRIVCEASHLSQSDFAKSIGIAQSHLSGLMKNRNPSLKVISKICEVWGCHSEWLRTGNGEKWRKHPDSTDPPELAKVIDFARQVFAKLDSDEERWEAAARMKRVLNQIENPPPHEDKDA